MFKLIHQFVFMLLLTGAFAAHAQATEVDDVLDQVIKAYGGEQNLRKLDRMTQEWDMVALMGNRHGKDVRSIRAPGQLRVNLIYPEKSETRIINDGTGYVIFDGAPAQQVAGIQRDAMQLQLMRLYSPLVLREKMGSIGLIEQGDLLALTLAEHGVHVHYMINRENWHIEKVAGVLLMNGNEIQFLTEYSDFAVIDDVLVHQKENKFASGMNTAVLQLRNITFDAKFDEKLFNP